ncbi:MAG: hypothetical protein FWH52_02285 [Synergistaceae bacterium]|nr:hypothetical protein [Synergistaceae bacterium]
MIHNILKPDISPDFTIEDIHKIRTWEYERLKDATREERMEDVGNRAAEAFAQIEALRASSRAVNAP